MLQNTPNPRVQVIATLSKFRQEWQEASNCKSLIETEGNVGLIPIPLVFPLMSNPWCLERICSMK